MDETMRLFRVEVGGALYWAIGTEGTPAEMQAAIEATEGVTFEAEMWEPIEVPDIREIGEAEARHTKCRGDGEPDTDMWSAAQQTLASGGRVVACSEWP